jgi:MFS family permease
MEKISLMSFKGISWWVLCESGVSTVVHSGQNVLLILTSRFIRQFAYGCSTLILALYFRALGHSDERHGLFMTFTLLGDVIISLWLTSVTDSLGRRRILILGAVLMVAAGSIFAMASNYWVLLGAAIIGVISPRCVFTIPLGEESFYYRYNMFSPRLPSSGSQFEQWK